MTKVQELEHRLAMVMDDLKVIHKFITSEGLTELFEKQSATSDTALTNLNNIEIACDLNSDECLGWGYYNSKEINDIIERLKAIDVDGEQMEFILEKVGMTDQMHRQLIMNNPESDTKDLLEEKIGFSILGLQNLVK